MIELTETAKPVFTVALPTIGEIHCKVCSYSDYMRLKFGQDPKDILISVGIEIEDIHDVLLNTVGKIWAREYLSQLHRYKHENMDVLEIPHDGSTPEKKCHMYMATMEKKLVSDYTRLDFVQIGEINIIDYWLVLSDAYKQLIFQNKLDAVDYLNGCYCYMHDLLSPDILPDNISSDRITVI